MATFSEPRTRAPRIPGAWCSRLSRHANGYERTPTIVVQFQRRRKRLGLGANLVADANGDLFGTTQTGGVNGTGTAFEITNSGFATTPSPLPPPTPVPSDFYDNGYSDILLQNTNGQAAIWEMNGTNVISEAAVGGNPGPSWQAIGTGDFNDDGHSDILLQNTNGQAAIWEMNGTNVISDAAVGANPGPSWKAIGTGDFNDDGHSDILLQNTNGQVAIWEMNGTNVIGAAAVGPNPGPSWKAIGTGDFNDDGHSDILLQNTNGQVAIWEMNGTNVISDGCGGPQSWAELESDRNRRLQRRRPFRHPVAEHERSGRDLGNERDQRNRRCCGGPQPWAELESDRNGRLQRRRPFRHSVAEHERSGRDLGNERDQRNRRWLRWAPILGRVGSLLRRKDAVSGRRMLV